MALIVKNPYFVEDLGRKVHNLHTDTLKVMLTNTDPTGQRYKAGVIEIAAGNGYVAGGFAIPGNSWAQVGGVAKLGSSADPGFSATGAVGPFRYAVVYNDTAANDEVIGHIDRGASLSLNNTESYSLDIDQINGLFDLQ